MSHSVAGYTERERPLLLLLWTGPPQAGAFPSCQTVTTTDADRHSLGGHVGWVVSRLLVWVLGSHSHTLPFTSSPVRAPWWPRGSPGGSRLRGGRSLSPWGFFPTSPRDPSCLLCINNRRILSAFHGILVPRWVAARPSPVVDPWVTRWIPVRGGFSLSLSLSAPGFGHPGGLGSGQPNRQKLHRLLGPCFTSQGS